MGNVALRGEAALRTRLPKEAKNSAAISPCERALSITYDCLSELDRGSTTSELISAQTIEDSKSDCIGELMQCSRNGNIFSKRASSLLIAMNGDVIFQVLLFNH